MSGSGAPKLLYEISDGVCSVTLNRPRVLNAVDADLKVQLADAVSRFEHDDDLRVLVLAGSDCGAFSVGSDIKDSAAEFDGAAQVDAPPYSHIVAACTKPVIAAIDGYCRGLPRQATAGLAEVSRPLAGGTRRRRRIPDHESYAINKGRLHDQR